MASEGRRLLNFAERETEAAGYVCLGGSGFEHGGDDRGSRAPGGRPPLYRAFLDGGDLHLNCRFDSIERVSGNVGCNGPSTYWLRARRVRGGPSAIKVTDAPTTPPQTGSNGTLHKARSGN